MEALLLVLFAFAVVIPVAILRGFVLSWLWLWFLVPLGVPPIGVAHAFGIMMIVALVKNEKVERDKDDKFAGFKHLGLNVIGALLAWGIGYIVAGLM